MRDQKLDTLSAVARQYSGPIVDALNRLARPQGARRARAPGGATRRARASRCSGLTRGTQGLQTYVASDSTAQREIGDLQFAVALEAARTRRVARGTEAGNVGRVAEAALPLWLTAHGRPSGPASTTSPSTRPRWRTSTPPSSLVRQRVLVAGAPRAARRAAGRLPAWRGAFSRRVRRMEHAAAPRGARATSARASSRALATSSASSPARFDDMQRQLAELETARRRFIATASHELRTPIFSLGGFLELLEDEELDEETRAAFLHQLRQQVDRLGKLATELLDLSRLEAGSLELRPEPTDVGELAKTVAAEFTPALAAHESHLELRLTGGRVEAVCDPERVAQIMRILLDNALNHTPAGTDVVLAATRRNGHARLAVTDSGTGIRRGDLERVFEPFYTSDDAQGSGLGLAIAHELAERMEGDLTAESVPGRTTFTLELPL